MKKPKNKKELIEFLKQDAKSKNWDELALAIIAMELLLLEEKSDKMLKLLEIKLEIFESEKLSRVFDTFNMERFLNKDIEEYEVEY